MTQRIPARIYNNIFSKMTLHFNSSTDDSMFMRGVTWSRDSHGLFDYESRNVCRKSLMISESGGRILRVDNDIRIEPPFLQVDCPMDDSAGTVMSLQEPSNPELTMSRGSQEARKD